MQKVGGDRRRGAGRGGNHRCTRRDTTVPLPARARARVHSLASEREGRSGLSSDKVTPVARGKRGAGAGRKATFPRGPPRVARCTLSNFTRNSVNFGAPVLRRGSRADGSVVFCRAFPLFLPPSLSRSLSRSIDAGSSPARSPRLGSALEFAGRKPARRTPAE